MQPGSRKAAVELAKARWAAIFDFDLDEATWQRLFDEYQPGSVIQAISQLRNTRDPQPEKVFPRFERFIALNETRSIQN